MSRDDAIQNVWSKDTVFRMETACIQPCTLFSCTIQYVGMKDRVCMAHCACKLAKVASHHVEIYHTRPRTLPVGLPDSDGVSLNTWYLEMFQDISL